ncbi:MAG: KH domain-containing protein [Clostridia bacterium]
MKELLTYIAESLVTKPEAVSVTEVLKGETLVLELRVDPSDMGRVIGRNGKIAKDIRTLIKSVGSRDNVKVLVDIVD